MPCPYHPNAPVTTESIPVEVYALGGAPLSRFPDAFIETCGQCGTRYYDEQLLATMSEQKPPWGTPQTPAYDYGDC